MQELRVFYFLLHVYDIYILDLLRRKILLLRHHFPNMQISFSISAKCHIELDDKQQEQKTIDQLRNAFRSLKEMPYMIIICKIFQVAAFLLD